MNLLNYKTSGVSFWKSIGYLVLTYVLMIVLSLLLIVITGSNNSTLVLSDTLIATVLAYIIVIAIDKRLSNKVYNNLREYREKKDLATINGLTFTPVAEYEEKMLNNNYPYDRGYLIKEKSILLFTYIFFAGVSLSIILNYVFSILDSFLPISEAELEFAGLFETDMWFVIVMAVVIAPFFEEYIFRKILLRGFLRNGYSKKFAIGLSAVLFGLYHGNVRQFLLATLLGIILGLVQYYTGRLVYSVLLHFAFNFTSVMMSFMLSEDTLLVPFGVLLMAFVLFGVIVFAVRRSNLLYLERANDDH